MSIHTAKKPPPTLLCILDGVGLNPNTSGNAVALAKKPVLDNLFNTCPWTTLITHGTKVGLPDDHMGNSEVGHLNIGAGRVVEQWLYRISKELDNGALALSTEFSSFCGRFKSRGAVHLVGLFSYGGVHSDAAHLPKIIESLKQKGIDKIVLHVILDGRDTSPKKGLQNVTGLLDFLKAHPECQIGTIIGRFFAMDRDRRWERTEKAYRAIALGEGIKINDPILYLQECYQKGITDEFIEPAILNSNSVAPDDLVLFYNFRADRMRQIVAALTDPSFIEFNRDGAIFASQNTLCFTEYDPKLKLPFIFENTTIKNHLGEVVSAHGLSQLRVAETEKYPHVTYFLNGLNENLFPGEARELIPSPREVRTYDLKPEMSAHLVCDTVINGINSGKYDLIIVNFANCDMVGHTGVLAATIKAVETVDFCLGKILSALDKVNGQALIIADHGNAEQMIDYISGDPHTAHTTYPVPAIIFNSPIARSLNSGGALCDVAPTILKMMGVSKPEEMTGDPLF